MRRAIICIPVWQRTVAFFLLLTLSLNTFSGIAQAEEPLTLAVHPYLPFKEIMARLSRTPPPPSVTPMAASSAPSWFSRTPPRKSGWSDRFHIKPGTIP
jgi:hypothetical protein